MNIISPPPASVIFLQQFTNKIANIRKSPSITPLSTRKCSRIFVSQNRKSSNKPCYRLLIIVRGNPDGWRSPPLLIAGVNVRLSVTGIFHLYYNKFDSVPSLSYREHWRVDVNAICVQDFVWNVIWLPS